MNYEANYTYSKSIDLASIPENRQLTSNGLASNLIATSIINSWFTNDMKAVSDYDEQHLFSALWVVELPFGKGKRLLGNTNRAKCALGKSGQPVGRGAHRRLGHRHRIPPSTVICCPVM